MQYTTIDRIFTKFERDIKGDVDELDIITWTGEALEFINAIRAKEEAVAFLKVKNYQTELPTNLHNIIQIAKNTKIDDVENTPLIKADDDVKLVNPLDEQTDYPVCIDCNGQPYAETKIAYYRPYYNTKYNFGDWVGNNIYQRTYVPVRLTNHSFFDALVCDLGNELYTQKQYEYTVIEGTILRFNFEKGLVALAYLRNPQDENGLPLIPDDISFTTAIVNYITWKLNERHFYSGVEGAQNKMIYAKQQWSWYCKQSSNKSLMPRGIDEMENLVKQTKYLIPRRNVYQNYFGNLNNKELKNILQHGTRKGY